MHPPVVRRLACLLLASLPACGDDAASSVTATGASTSSSSSSSSSTSPTEVTTTSGPDTTGTTDDATASPDSTGGDDTGFPQPEAVCGNGYLEADEECDDANDVEDDQCTSQCEVPCGLALQVVELAPTAESDLWAQTVTTAPDGGFVVVALQREVTSDQEGKKTIGATKTRVIRYAPDATPLWDRLYGPDDADFTPGGGVVDAAGDLYIAAAQEGADETDIAVLKLAGADGEPIWSHEHDGALAPSADAPTGLALAPDDAIVVVGTTRDVDKDDDVWIRKLSAASGEEIWTTSWTGPGNGEYSTDEGGRVAVAPDGTVYVSAQEYVNYKTKEAVLLRLSPKGVLAWKFTPLADGSEHVHVPGAVSVDASGAALFAVTRPQTIVPAFWLYKIDADQKIAWELDRDDFIVEEAGDSWTLGGASLAPDGTVALTGYYRAKDKMASFAWFKIWTARLDADGGKRCQIEYTAPSEDLLPPSVYSFDLAVGADETAVASGQLIAEGESQLWTGLFRSP